MRVIALRNWRDLKEGVRRVEGDVFTVSKERYDEIMAKNARLVGVYEPEGGAEPEKEPEAERELEPEAEPEAPKRTTRKRGGTAKKNG